MSKIKKITIFDLKKHEDALKKLEARKAPAYVIEAYNCGYTKEINSYYKLKLDKRLSKQVVKENKSLLDNLVAQAINSKYDFLKEAANQRDEDFLRQFFVMTNLDIVTGRKLPPNAGSLIKQGIIKDLSLKDLFKKLR